jgi:hypothetical protein
MRPIRISIIGSMVLVAGLAVDLAVLRAIASVSMLPTRIALLGALPMANALAVYLVVVVSGLANRGEVALSGVAFLFVGGTAILLLVSIANLAPLAFYEYIDLTASPLQDLWQRLWLTQAQRDLIARGTMMPPLHTVGTRFVNPIQGLLACAVVTPPLLVPALLAGWATRGHRLRLVKGHEAAGDGGRQRRHP